MENATLQKHFADQQASANKQFTVRYQDQFPNVAQDPKCDTTTTLAQEREQQYDARKHLNETTIKLEQGGYLQEVRIASTCDHSRYEPSLGLDRQKLVAKTLSKLVWLENAARSLRKPNDEPVHSGQNSANSVRQLMNTRRVSFVQAAVSMLNFLVR